MGDTPDADRASPQPSPGSESPNRWTFFDSDGEEYDVYSDGTHELTDKEWREYKGQVEESDVSKLQFDLPFSNFLMIHHSLYLCFR